MDNGLGKDINWLTMQHWGFDLSLREMEKLAGLNPTHGASITYWMEKYNIPRRKNPKGKQQGVAYELLDDINWLTMQHWGFNLSLQEIAKLIGSTPIAHDIKKAMERLSIPIHSKGSLNSELQTIEYHHYPLWLIEQHYDKQLSLVKISKISDVSHDTISQLMHSYNFPINDLMDAFDRDEHGRKFCPHCNRWQEVENFGKSNDWRTPDGLKCFCKKCRRNEGEDLRWESRILALQIYSNGYMKCELCGGEDIDVLTIDHIGGGGYKHRKENNIKGQFGRWLKRNNYPEGFRVLCWNCQHKERLNKKDQWKWNCDKDYTLELRIIALQIYSDGFMKCALCGCDDIDCLAIDHIAGGGYKHRKAIKGNLYNWLKRNNYPDGFRILCHNCNHKEKLRLQSS